MHGTRQHWENRCQNLVTSQFQRDGLKWRNKSCHCFKVSHKKASCSHRFFLLFLKKGARTFSIRKTLVMQSLNICLTSCVLHVYVNFLWCDHCQEAYLEATENGENGKFHDSPQTLYLQKRCTWKRKSLTFISPKIIKHSIWYLFSAPSSYIFQILTRTPFYQTDLAYT